MFCLKCGKENPDGAKFCSSCGGIIEAPVEPVAPITPAEPVAPVATITPAEPVAPVVPTTPVEPVAPTAFSGSYSTPAPAPQKPNKKKGIVIGAVIGAVVLVLIVVGVLVAVLNGGDDKDDVKPNTKVEETVSAEDKETTTEEPTTEAPKGDEKHDGRLIGSWTGTETVETEGFEMKVAVSYNFYDDGSYTMIIDEESFKEATRNMLYQMFKDEFGFTKEQTDEAIETAYGMTMDEYLIEMLDQIGLEKSYVGKWETADGKLFIVSDVEEDPFAYRFSDDGNTLYADFEDGSKGEYKRVEQA